MSLGSLTVSALDAGADPREGVHVRIVLVGSNEVDLSELVTALARATGVTVAVPTGNVTLPMTGLAGGLSRRMLSATLGEETTIRVDGEALEVTVPGALLEPSRRQEWEQRIRALASLAEREVRRRARYGMHATKSYRPNDASRPTVCLVHGVNSSSGGFVHTILPIEEAGYGVVVYDYPYNRSLEETCRRFAIEWAEFRRKHGEKRPWALVGHSMGALLARDYVEGSTYADDVSSLILIAPVNQGSGLAKTQTLLQFLNGLKAVNGQGRPANDPLAHLGDGLGEAANDMTPGSRFLTALNARPRRSGVAYHILAGDSAFLPAGTRKQIDDQIAITKGQTGVLGSLSRVALGDDLAGRLDEITDGLGDGCMSVARTRLEGVTDHVTIHANHAELIRAPLLFADPGPVACMPYLLQWLEKPKR
jgi:pimeloyl-ACP methyl ester carboxylesterase